ncbi:hypothetical protein LV779_30790 [Streptomyces thinghirensis]|nr:hypothetical protein [Streptomyces thinghirensis]
MVDARQSLHFKMVFETTRRAGWLNEDVTAQQLAFGTVLRQGRQAVQDPCG